MASIVSTAVYLPPSEDGERKIHLQYAGSRKHNDAAIVFVAGLGGSGLTFSTVQRQLANAGLYSVAYDRMGTGRSSSLPTFPQTEDSSKRSPKPRTAVDVAGELEEVLQAAKIQPPYIFCTHSYGGVIVTEYQAAHPHNVVGLIFVDANGARSAERTLGDPDLEVLGEGIEDKFDYCKIVGLDDNHQLLTEEFEEFKEKRDPPPGWSKGEHGGAAEASDYYNSCHALGRHNKVKIQRMGEYPVTVIKGNIERDLRKMVAESERLGGGTEEARIDISRKLDGSDAVEEEMQKEHLRLTSDSRGRFLQTQNSGHWVHVTEPEVVTAEIELMVGVLRREGLLQSWADGA